MKSARCSVPILLLPSPMPSNKAPTITDDDILPPSDTLAEAMYKSTKLDFLFPVPSKTTVKQETPTALTTTTSPQESSHQSQWKLLRTLAGAHQGWVRAVTVDEVTNNWFVTGSSDATIKIWDLASSQLKSTITGHIMGVRALVVSKKFPYLFSGSEDKTLRCWDLEKSNAPEGCQIKNFHGHVGGIYALSLHPQLDVVLSGGRDAVVRIWDIRATKEVALLSGHKSDITAIESYSNEPQVVTSSMDGTIRLWDLRNQKTELCITQHSKSIRAMAAHPLEQTFTSGDSNGNIKQWLLPNGELLNNFEKSKEGKIINTLSLNAVTNTLFAGYDDGIVEFYDYISGRLIQSGQAPALPGADGAAIYASTFDMSGLRLITCGGDKSIKIWGDTE